MSYSRTTYSRLFSKIGTTWGAGDGNTTFNIPNFTNRIPQGSGSRGTVGAYLAESLPNIYTEISSRKFEYGVGVIANVTGAGTFENDGYTATSNVYIAGGNKTTSYPLQKSTINASLSSSTYQDNAPVQQAATAVVFCIRY